MSAGVDGNGTLRERGEMNTTSTTGEKSLTGAKPAPPPLTRNLDSGPSMPTLEAGSAVTLWWWIAIVVAVVLAIVFVLWGRV